MESLRDVKRVMEREIEKGSCPLQFEYLEFGEKPFQFIESEKKLNEVQIAMMQAQLNPRICCGWGNIEDIRSIL